MALLPSFNALCLWLKYLSPNAEFEDRADSPRHAKIIKQLLNGTKKDTAAPLSVSHDAKALFSPLKSLCAE